MKSLSTPPLITLSISLAVILVFLVTLMLPWNNVEWGTIRLGQQRSITVTGTASLSEQNQVARFNASVRVENEDKETAVNSVNEAMTSLIADIKAFGIPEDDIKTQQVSVYEFDKRFEVEAFPRIEGQPPIETEKYWQASNSISIKLREIEQASALTDVLFASGATDVNGPSFHIEETDDYDAELLMMATKDARKKAERLAKASDAKLGNVLTIQEGFNSYPQPYFAAESYAVSDAGLSAPVEPGTSTLSKTVTVTFSLR